MGEAPQELGAATAMPGSCLDSALGIFLLKCGDNSQTQKEMFMKFSPPPDFLRVKETLKTGQRSNQVQVLPAYSDQGFCWPGVSRPGGAWLRSLPPAAACAPAAWGPGWHPQSCACVTLLRTQQCPGSKWPNTLRQERQPGQQHDTEGAGKERTKNWSCTRAGPLPPEHVLGAMDGGSPLGSAKPLNLQTFPVFAEKEMVVPNFPKYNYNHSF